MFDFLLSHAGVFTELIEQIGVKGVQVEELVDMENSTFAALKYRDCSISMLWF